MNVKTRIAGYLNKILEERGMSKAELARALNVSQGRLTEYLKGYNLPRADTLIKISEIGNISLDELLKEEEIAKELVRTSVNMDALHEEPDIAEIINILREDTEAKEAVLKLLKSRKQLIEAMEILQPQLTVETTTKVKAAQAAEEKPPKRKRRAAG